ncbi:MAG: MFS transporter [Trebonia sp.]
MLPSPLNVIEGQVHDLEYAAPSATRTAPRLSRPFIVALMIANFGTNVALIAPIENILPRMVESATGSAGKAVGLGIVTGLGAFAALVVNPLAGHLSDRWVSADNRARMVIIGLVTGGVAHAILGLQHSIVSIAIWWTLCQATINIAYSPMSAIVVDHVDRRSWGFVWGLISMAQAVGLIVGFAAVVLVFPSVTGGMTAISVGYVVCLIPLVFVLYWLPRVSYPPGGGRPPDVRPGGPDRKAADLIGPTRTNGNPSEQPPVSSADRSDGEARGLLTGLTALLSVGQGFGLVWFGKFLVTLAETIALLYLFYYLQDVVHYNNPGRGQLILIAVATLAVIVATVTVGRIADRSGGYRRYAVLASLLMAAVGFVLAGTAQWALVIVCALALGAGYGAFQSVSQALSIVVLPDQAHAGRDLGIINVASAVPQVIGAPIAGLVVAGAGGYRGLFVFAGLLAIAAALVFTRVRS